MPGQTIEDVCAAEARFVEEVARCHPEAEGKPVIDRQLPGRLADHDDGRDPARSCAARSCWPARRCPTGRACAARTRCAISAALLGGTWLTALAGDLGNGIFDGANLVANFESLQSGQHLLGEALQPLFEGRHRGGALPRLRDLVGQPGAAQCRRDAVDRRQSVRRQQARPRARSHTSDGVRVDLRNIHSPIIVFCSWGDNITPPQQALGWITDLYDHERRDRRQRPDHRLHAAPDDRPSRHLRLGQGGDQGACRVRLVHGDDRPPAARPLRGGDHRGRRQHRPSRPDPRQVPVPAGGAHAGRHPGARRQQRGGQPALRRRGARFRDQSRASTARFAQPAVQAMANEPERRR